MTLNIQVAYIHDDHEVVKLAVAMEGHLAAGILSAWLTKL